MKGEMPPITDTHALPLFCPQLDGETVETLALSNVGSVMPTVADTEHPLASVTVTVWVPAQRLVALGTVCSEGDHRNA